MWTGAGVQPWEDRGSVQGAIYSSRTRPAGARLGLWTVRWEFLGAPGHAVVCTALACGRNGACCQWRQASCTDVCLCLDVGKCAPGLHGVSRSSMQHRSSAHDDDPGARYATPALLLLPCARGALPACAAGVGAMMLKIKGGTSTVRAGGALLTGVSLQACEVCTDKRGVRPPGWPAGRQTPAVCGCVVTTAHEPRHASLPASRRDVW